MPEKLCRQAYLSGLDRDLDIMNRLNEVCDKVYKDKYGNIIGIKTKTGGKRILLDAHMDEIGLVVSGIKDDGTLEFISAGGVDPRILPCAQVIVHGKKDIPGVIGAKPPHLLSDDDMKKAVKMADLSIDVGYSDPSEIVSVGDFVTFKPNFSELSEDYITSKSLDNRCSLEAVISAVESLKDCPNEIIILASSGEERGCVGALGAMNELSADIAIVTDVTFGASPGCDEDCTFPLGSGVALCTGPNICITLFEKIVDIAKNNNIPYSVEVEGGDAGTNAGVIQISGEGIATAMISIPIRYMHTPVEVAKRSDIEYASKLIAEVCMNA